VYQLQTHHTIIYLSVYCNSVVHDVTIFVIEANICPTFLLRNRVAGNGGQVNREYANGKSIIFQFDTALSSHVF
jgi:hypothetical protein